jgi:hypothetical protein
MPYQMYLMNMRREVYVTCITIIDTIILTNYTNDAYIFYDI